MKYEIVELCFVRFAAVVHLLVREAACGIVLDRPTSRLNQCMIKSRVACGIVKWAGCPAQISTARRRFKANMSSPVLSRVAMDTNETHPITAFPDSTLQMSALAVRMCGV